MKKKVWVHQAASFEDAERWDAWFWRQAGAAARFEAAWAMVGEFLKMRGKPRAQLRLRRSFMRVRRRSISALLKSQEFTDGRAG